MASQVRSLEENQKNFAKAMQKMLFVSVDLVPQLRKHLPAGGEPDGAGAGAAAGGDGSLDTLLTSLKESMDSVFRSRVDNIVLTNAAKTALVEADSVTTKDGADAFIERTRASMKPAAVDYDSYFMRDRTIQADLKKWREAAGGDDRDDDVAMVGGSTSLKCPISLTRLVNPVRSSHCLHTYSRDSIMAILRRGRGKCPVGGCGKPLTAAMLEPDAQMAYLLEQAERDDQLATQADDDGAGYESLDDSD